MKDQGTMKSNRLAVSAASLRCTDEVKVVSRETLGSRMSVTWGICWLASVAKKDGETGRRFPTVRYKHFLGLIGKSHSPAYAQAKERVRTHVFCLNNSDNYFTRIFWRNA